MVNMKKFNATHHLVSAGVVTVMATFIAVPRFKANQIALIFQVKHEEFQDSFVSILSK